jgi:hypothetical protein
MKIILPRARRINIWDYGSLERLGKIFQTNFNHDYREQSFSSSDDPKIFMLEVLEIQVAPIAAVISFARLSRGFSIKFDQRARRTGPFRQKPHGLTHQLKNRCPFFHSQRK